MATTTNAITVAEISAIFVSLGEMSIFVLDAGTPTFVPPGGAEIKWFIVARTLLKFTYGKHLRGKKNWASRTVGDGACRT